MKKTTKPNSLSSKVEDTVLKNPETQEWEKLNILAGHWQSDLKFYQDEIRFLHNLISKYFMWLTEDENLLKTKQIAKELSVLEVQRQVCDRKLSDHKLHYQELFENPFSHDSQKFKDEHIQLEKGMTDFVKSFRAIKQATFELTEHVIESEKIKHLIGKTVESK